MARGMGLAVMAAAFLAAAGCTAVQKGAVAGGGVGAGTGALIGHSAGTVGSGAGALAGFGIGAFSGAIAGDIVYSDDDTQELQAAAAQLQKLDTELKARDGQMAELNSALQKEKAQQKALLDAYDKARTDQGRQGARTLSATTAAASGANDVTFTLGSGVLFASGSAKLTSGGRAALKRTARTIKSKYPGAAIEVRGHTDSTPIKHSPYKSNWELSYARAVAVVEYMVETEGFSPGAFTTTGFGDTRPVASNSTASGRSKNRRAEIVVHPSGSQATDTGMGG